MKTYLGFEYSFYFKKPWFYFSLAAITAIGFFAGYNFTFSVSPEIFKNAPYTTTQMLGLLSLISIFIATPLAAQVLFRDKESGFNLILHSSPVRKITVLGARFLVVAGIVILSFIVLTTGYASAHLFKAGETGFGSFNIFSYLWPLLILGIPNAFFCAAIICGVAWITGNRLLVYVSGLFIYIFYMAALLFSRSPMMAGSLPPDPAAMHVSALLDPFGLSAFFQQTATWSVAERNGEQVSLNGNLLLNRLVYTLFSSAVLYAGFLLVKFRAAGSIRKKGIKTSVKENPTDFELASINVDVTSIRYQVATVLSFVKADSKLIFKSVSFLLVLIGFAFFISMEIYSEIDKGVRLPESYASTELMVNRIISGFPGLCILVLLFYSSEIIWRSRVSRFDLIENSTPVSDIARITSRWISLNVIVAALLVWMIMIGILFQFIYAYPDIDVCLYLSLFYLAAFPLTISAGIMVFIQTLIRNRYAGLAVATVFILLTTTGTGRMIGLRDPLIRFHSAFNSRFSEMNGWGSYMGAFNLRMLFAASVLIMLIGLLLVLRENLNSRRRKYLLIVLIPIMLISIVAGFIFEKESSMPDKKEQLNWQEDYERKFKQFDKIPQPVITDVETTVDLFPETDNYKIKGIYIVQNKSERTIDSILLYLRNEKGFATDSLVADNAVMVADEKQFGHYWYKLATSLQPGDSMRIRFAFSYRWNGFTRHDPFNAIIGNGSFMRISRYYPAIGYQTDNAIDDSEERKLRNLPALETILPLDSPRKMQQDLIKLNMTISTSEKQHAIGIGELADSWEKDGRKYFRYECRRPVPFRFGISSAEYEVNKSEYKGRSIAVYYHPTHKENVGHLVENAKKTLDYCELNFTPYPYNTIRFAEVSGFTQGFAATAYPATIFMTEDLVFHSNINADRQQDVINELAGHELAHTWWGNTGIIPDYREGAAILTETMAMYTEFMLVKKMYGYQRLLENVRLHEGIYLNGRGFGEERPLIYADPEERYLTYSKGAVVMYQLSELLGEETLNRALKNLLIKFRYPAPVPVSSDLVSELYLVCDSSLHRRIDDLFSKVTTYEFRLKQKLVTKIGNTYRIELSIDADKMYTDSGKITKVRFHDSLEIEIASGEKKREFKIPVKNNSASVIIELDFKPEKLIFDPRELFIKSGEMSSVELE